MAFASYALTSVTVFLLVFVLWQGLVSHHETDPQEKAAARRSAGLFGVAAVATAVAAVVTRLLA
jgi:heme/copper-type cytochrome/quinol oxidase subunit 2